MFWDKLNKLKGAQIVRILCKFTVYVRNIFAFTVLPWYLKALVGENVNQIRMRAARWQLKYSMLYL
jgi:hypothetical protein